MSNLNYASKNFKLYAWITRRTNWLTTLVYKSFRIFNIEIEKSVKNGIDQFHFWTIYIIKPMSSYQSLGTKIREINVNKKILIHYSKYGSNLQTVSRDIFQISHEITPWSAGLPQREGSTRELRPLCSVRDRRERPAESGARVRKAVNQPDCRWGVEQGRMA